VVEMVIRRIMAPRNKDGRELASREGKGKKLGKETLIGWGRDPINGGLLNAANKIKNRIAKR